MNSSDKVIKQRMKEKQTRINKAMDRKDKSIAFWAAMNNAIQFVALSHKPETDLGSRFSEVKKYHQLILEVWQEWYLEALVMPVQEEMTEKEKKERVRMSAEAEAEQIGFEESEKIRRQEAESEYEFGNI